MALVAQEVFQQLEFANGQIEETLTAHGQARHEIQLEIGRLETKNLRRAATPQQRTDAREQFRKGKRLDQVVIGAQIQTKHAILDAIAGRQDEDRRLEVTLSQGLQDLEPASAGKHQVEDHEIEGLRAGAKEAVLAGRGHHDIVVLRLECRCQHLGQLPFVLDDQDTHR